MELNSSFMNVPNGERNLSFLSGIKVLRGCPVADSYLSDIYGVFISAVLGLITVTHFIFRAQWKVSIAAVPPLRCKR